MTLTKYFFHVTVFSDLGSIDKSSKCFWRIFRDIYTLKVKISQKSSKVLASGPCNWIENTSRTKTTIHVGIASNFFVVFLETGLIRMTIPSVHWTIETKSKSGVMHETQWAKYDLRDWQITKMMMQSNSSLKEFSTMAWRQRRSKSVGNEQQCRVSYSHSQTGTHIRS